MSPNLTIDRLKLDGFCRKNHIRWLALFGSALRSDFRPESDVDILVRFDQAHMPGLIRMGAMSAELSVLLAGRAVDFLTPEDLSDYFRDDVLSKAEVLYEQS